MIKLMANLFTVSAHRLGCQTLRTSYTIAPLILIPKFGTSAEVFGNILTQTNMQSITYIMDTLYIKAEMTITNSHLKVPTEKLV